MASDALATVSPIRATTRSMGSTISRWRSNGTGTLVLSARGGLAWSFT